MGGQFTGRAAKNCREEGNQARGSEFTSPAKQGFPMYDIAYLRKLAERYRKLAHKFNHTNIRERLEVLADDLEEKVRDLQHPAEFRRIN